MDSGFFFVYFIGSFSRCSSSYRFLSPERLRVGTRELAGPPALLTHSHGERATWGSISITAGPEINPAE